LLDLGAGLHGDLTGRENLFAMAIVAGLRRREVEQCFEEIVAFAELGQFIDNPVRTYSTGMMMRLAFAVAIHTRPQVLLVDEYLSVGDVAFQAKCLRRIADLQQQGCAIVLISHSVKQVQELCDRALWLSQGQMMAYGEPQVVAGQYNAAMQAKTQLPVADLPGLVTRSGMELKINENRFGSLAVRITDVRFLARVQSGSPLVVEILFESPELVENPRFALSITRSDGEACVETNSDDGQLFVTQIGGTGRVRLSFDRLDLTAGEYFINVGVFEADWRYAYDYHWHVYPLIVEGSRSPRGVLSPPLTWSMEARSTLASDDPL
jgi:lipopolysaccharide transport system ATP-binding protein